MVLLLQKALNLFKNIIHNDKNPRLNMRIKRWTKYVCLLWLLFLSLNSHAQKRYELTVQQAVDMAFQNLADVKNAQLDYRIQEEQNRGIEGQVYPQLSGSAGMQYYIQTPKILFPDASQAGI